MPGELKWFVEIASSTRGDALRWAAVDTVAAIAVLLTTPEARSLIDGGVPSEWVLAHSQSQLDIRCDQDRAHAGPQLPRA